MTKEVYAMSIVSLEAKYEKNISVNCKLKLNIMLIHILHVTKELWSVTMALYSGLSLRKKGLIPLQRNRSQMLELGATVFHVRFQAIWHRMRFLRKNQTKSTMWMPYRCGQKMSNLLLQFKALKSSLSFINRIYLSSHSIR